MADKDFKVKNKLFVNGLSNASGVILATNNNLDSSTTLPTQYGGTGTTTSPNAGQIPYSSSGTNYAPTDLSSLTISSSGGSTITAASASTKGLVIQGAASQTANLQQWQDSGGNVLTRVQADGTISWGTGTSALQNSSGRLVVNPSSASAIAVIVKGAASQTANLQEWQNSSGTALSYITKDGTLDLRNTSATAFAFTNSGTVGPKIDLWGGQYGIGIVSGRMSFFTPASGGIALKQDSYSGTSVFDVAYSGAAVIGLQSASAIGLVIKGYTSQTANLQEWQNSAGTVLARINAGGVIKSNMFAGLVDGYSVIQFNYDTNGVGITPQAAAQKGLIIRGAASQTANLTEWQNSSGTVLASVDSYGNMVSQALSTGITRVSFAGLYGASLNVIPYGTAQQGIIVRAVASQTANLQEWQNSAGTVLASIASTGQINAGAGFYTDWAGVGTGRIGAAHLSVSSQYLGNIVSIFKGISGQTANLTEWQNSSGTVLASISAAGNLTVQDLTVNGTTTTINSTTLTVDDRNIELASVASPTDTTADGAGITIKGATDKTFNWVQSTGAFTSSEPISTPALSVSGNSVSSNITLAAGKRYFVDTTSARTLTLPASPSLGDEIKIFDASGTAATNNITIARNGNKINGITDDAIIDVNQASSAFVYTGATVGWRFE